MAIGRTSTTRNGVLAALDIGTSKVCCFVAKRESSGDLRVIGIGHQAAQGLKGGAVADMDAAELSIRSAVDAAERMAGHTIERVLVNLSGGRPTSHSVDVEVSIDKVIKTGNFIEAEVVDNRESFNTSYFIKPIDLAEDNSKICIIPHTGK